MKKVIGVDIGGTKINFAVLNEDGTMITKKKVKIENHLDYIMDALYDGISELKEYEPEAVGIGTAGFIDSENGVVKFSGNLNGFTGLKLKEEIETKVALPVFVENDANIAALCEKWIGNAQEFRSFVMLTMGTGLGGAIYGERIGLWSGSNFQGAELGHIIMYPNGRLCTCGQKGCYEKYIAGSALALNYQDLTGEWVSGEDIILRAQGKDGAALKALDRLSYDLSIALIAMKNIFDPQAVIIGGGFIESREFWWERALTYYQQNCNRTEGMQILPAKFLNDSGVIGAAKFAFDQLIR